MSKVDSFELSEGARIGNYRVMENIGRGWEGEVYKVEEVPTEAVRAMKIMRMDDRIGRSLTHTAWYFEQLKATGHVPVYYHYGQTFLNDDNGCWYLIFEYIDGDTLGTLIKRGCGMNDEGLESVFFDIAKAVAEVHRADFAVGDIGADRVADLGNVMFDKGGRVVFVDLEPGVPDKPNRNFRNDCVEELPRIADRMFKSRHPRRVEDLLVSLANKSRIGRESLRKALSELEE